MKLLKNIYNKIAYGMDQEEMYLRHKIFNLLDKERYFNDHDSLSHPVSRQNRKYNLKETLNGLTSAGARKSHLKEQISYEEEIIEIDNERKELQDTYLFPGKNHPNKENIKSVDKGYCVICFEMETHKLVLNYETHIICEDCLKNIKLCPVCRKVIN